MKPRPLSFMMQAQQDMRLIQTQGQLQGQMPKESGAGINPQVLEAALVRFYSKYEPSKVNNLGPIINWTLTAGMDALNFKLVEKYGVDLDSMQNIPLKKANSAPLMSASMLNPNDVDPNIHDEQTLRRLDSAVRITGSHLVMKKPIRAQLKEFYAKHDPSKNSGGNTDAIMEWVGQHSMEDLNNLLLSKYGEDLNGKNVPRAPVQPRMAVSVNFARIDGPPPTVRSWVEAFYATHDPDKDIEPVIMWTMREGMEKLDKRLQTKYGEGLAGFQEEAIRRQKFRSLLESFYLEVEPSKLADGFEDVLRFGLENGSKALNSKLHEKYAKDLNSFQSTQVQAEMSRQMAQQVVQYQQMQPQQMLQQQAKQQYPYRNS